MRLKKITNLIGFLFLFLICLMNTGPAQGEEIVGFCRLDIPEGKSIAGNPFSASPSDPIGQELLEYPEITSLWKLQDSILVEYVRNTEGSEWVSKTDNTPLVRNNEQEGFIISVSSTLSIYFLGKVRQDTEISVTVPEGDSLISLPWPNALPSLEFSSPYLRGATDPIDAQDMIFTLDNDGYHGFYFNSEIEDWVGLDFEGEIISQDFMDLGKGILYKNLEGVFSLTFNRPF